MSGYGLCNSFLKKGHPYLMNFYKRKIYKIVLPVTIITIIFLIIKFLFERKLDIINTFFSTNTILPNSWFIWILLLEYFFFYYIFKNLKDIHKCAFISLLCSCFLIYILKQMNFGHYWWGKILCFNIGIYYAIYETMIKNLFNRNTILFITISLLFMWSWYLYHTVRIQIFIDAILPIILVEITYLLDTSKFYILKKIGKYSFDIYMLHGVLLYIIKQITK